MGILYGTTMQHCNISIVFKVWTPWFEHKQM